MSSNSSLCGADAAELFTSFGAMYVCMALPVGLLSIASFASISFFLVVPACVLVLVLALGRRRRPGATAAAVSHSDFFTYVTAVVQLQKFGGSLVIVFAVLACAKAAVRGGVFGHIAIFYGEVGLHMLTCLDRHLAAVHPHAYRGLRGGRGVRMRNAALAAVWLFAVASATSQVLLSFWVVLVGYVCYVCAAIVVVSFCSVSVLRVLFGPRPGEGGGAPADPSKLRALHTIAAILGVLLLKFGGNIVSAVLYKYADLPMAAKCGLWLSELWLSLPCSLVLPLLFLLRNHRFPPLAARGARGPNGKSAG